MSYSFTDLDNKSKLWVVEAEDGITKKSMETKEEEEEEEVVVDITTEEEEGDITTEKAEVDIMIIIMVTVITLRIMLETEAGVCTMFW